MTLRAVREKLHSYIDNADDKKLKAIYTLLESDMNINENVDEELLKELDNRWDKYTKGESKTYTLEESMNMIRKHRGNKKNNAA